MSNKRSWPELVGQPADDAVATIQQENPNLNVVKVHKDSGVTRDLRQDRVRVFHDDNGNVHSVPRTG